MKFIKELTITKKLYSGFGAVLVLVLAMFFIGAFSPWTLNQQSVQERLNRSINSTRFVRNLRLQMLRNRANLATYLLSGSAPDLNDFENGRRDFQTYAREVLIDPISEEQKNGVNAAVAAEANWYNIDVLPLIRKRTELSNKNLDGFHTYFLARQPWGADETANKALDAVEKASQNEIDSERKADKDSAYRTIRDLLIVGGLALIFVGVIAYYTAKSITEPLNQLMKVARDIGESGDLEQSFVIDRKDEI